MAHKTLLALFALFALSIQAFAYENDDRIANDVSAAVAALDEIKPYSLKVEVENGAVTLKGKVPTESARRRIKAAALTVPGVEKVEDNLVVTYESVASPDSSEESELCDSVRAELATTRKADDFRVTIECRDREVILLGTAATDTDIAAIESTVRKVPGVSSVVNELRIPPEVGDARLYQTIHDQLTRQGIPLHNVQFSVRDGIVTFTGRVVDHEEIDKILARTLMIKGVSDVKSEVAIGE